MNKQRHYDNNIDLLRLIAAFMVFAGHMSSLMGYPTPMFLWQPANQVGVIIFFLFGGYLITQSWERDSNILRYLIKRFFRIMPAYAVCILITALIVGPVFTEVPIKDYFAHEQFGAYFKNLIFQTQFCLPAVFTQNPLPNVLNGSYWCLAVEVAMYVIIPLLYFVGDKLKIKKILFTVAAIVSTIASIIQLQFFPDFSYVIYCLDIVHAITIIPFYFIGAAVAVCKPDKRWFNPSVAIIVFFISHCFVLAARGTAWTLDIAVFSYVILSLGFMKPICNLEKIDISYGLFVWGFVVQQMTIHIFYVALEIYIPNFLVFLISLAITVGLSIISERLVERPCRRVAGKLCTIVKG